MTRTSPARIRVSGPADLLDALPRMLGYRPADSLVLVALRPPRSRIALTIRIDLPPPEGAVACAGMLAGHAERNGATSAILILYDDAADPGRRDPWRAGLVEAVRAELTGRGMALTDALLVSRGRWRSWLCDDPRCCPPAGRPLRPDDQPSAFAAALAVEGKRALPDREALARSVGPPGPELRAVMEPALARVADALARRVAAGEALADVRAETVATFAGVLRRYPRHPHLEPDEAARMLLGLVDVQARDEVLGWAARPDTDALLALLIELTRRAVPPDDAPAASALAWVAYARGDGTLANVALDRALGSDPGYSMARLVREGLDRGIHPRYLRQVSREVTDDLRAERGRRRRVAGQRTTKPEAPSGEAS